VFYSQSKIKLYQNYKSLFNFIKLNLSGQLAIDHDFRLATGILNPTNKALFTYIQDSPLPSLWTMCSEIVLSA